MERSTSEQAVPALAPASGPAAPVEREEPAPHHAPDPVESTAPVKSTASTGSAVVRAVAAEQAPGQRVTRRIPQVAKSMQPRRTKDELLAEARQFTEAWPVEHLTADRIRKALRTSPEKGRWLRDTLKAERAAA